MERNVEHFLWHTTCNSLIGNLVLKDISDKNLKYDVNLILKEFKQTNFEKSILDKGGKRNNMACKTRWCSNRDAYENLFYNLYDMKQIIIDEKPKKGKPNIAKLVLELDDEFINKVIGEKKCQIPCAI